MTSFVVAVAALVTLAAVAILFATPLSATPIAIAAVTQISRLAHAMLARAEQKEAAED